MGLLPKLDLRALTRRAAQLLRQTDGPLTRDLLREPGAFGLGQVPARLAPDATTTVVCGFCSTGCGLTVHLRDGQAVNLSPASAYPVNLGMACPKGWEALAPLAAADRATAPLLRDSSGALNPVSWPRAIGEFCTRVRAVQQQHGPESVAFLGSGQLPTEELVFFGALAKFGLGMVHGDGNTRQCMATAATAYKESFGFDAPPYTYRDLEKSDVIVLVGSNLCIAHPILWERVCRNPDRPEIVVIDPRATETAQAATRHYAIEPKSDLAFFYGIAHLLIARGAVDREFVANHTVGFEAFAEFVAEFTPARVSAVSGISERQIGELADVIAQGARVSFWWTMGVNQSHEGVRVAQAIIALALLTGNIGRLGTGANSITGQCNAMGSRLYSNTTNLFGGRDFANAAQRGEVAEILGIPAERIPDRNGWAYDQIVEGIRSGAIRGLWIAGTNGAHSWIDQSDFRALLEKLDFLCVQDLYADTETAQRAHLVLPAAGWGEKDGTFINSERRIGLVKKVSRAPGQALSDFAIFRLIADAWGCGALFERWKTPEDVFDTVKELSRGRFCEITGIRDYRMLDEEGGVQWPLREGEAITANERRLFEGGVFAHADGRARFCFDPPRAVPEAPDCEYPFVLLTGRGSSAQWHTETRTKRSPVLTKLHAAEPCVEIHPGDAARLGIASGERVVLRSRRGEAMLVARVTASVQCGQLFTAMHHEGANRLTLRAFDPHSRQPSYKHCAVRLERIDGS